MKKLSMLLVAFVTLGLSSCSSDDNSDTATNYSVIGKWEFSQNGQIINGVETLQAYQHTAGCNKDYIEFKSNNTFEDVWYENTATGCISDKEDGTWSQSGTAFTTTYSGDEPETVEILILDASTLKIKSVTAEDGQVRTRTTVLKRM